MPRLRRTQRQPTSRVVSSCRRDRPGTTTVAIAGHTSERCPARHGRVTVRCHGGAGGDATCGRDRRDASARPTPCSPCRWPWPGSSTCATTSTTPPTTGRSFAASVVVAIATLSLAWRRRWPFTTLCVVAGAIAVPELFGALTFTLWGHFVPLLVAAYTVARWCNGRLACDRRADRRGGDRGGDAAGCRPRARRATSRSRSSPRPVDDRRSGSAATTGACAGAGRPCPPTRDRPRGRGRRCARCRAQPDRPRAARRGGPLRQRDGRAGRCLRGVPRSFARACAGAAAGGAGDRTAGDRRAHADARPAPGGSGDAPYRLPRSPASPSCPSSSSGSTASGCTSSSARSETPSRCRPGSTSPSSGSCRKRSPTPSSTPAGRRGPRRAAATCRAPSRSRSPTTGPPRARRPRAATA